MQTKLIQIEQRIAELEELASEVGQLAQKLLAGENVQPGLSVRGQMWYRGARELLRQYGFSGLEEFDECYRGKIRSYFYDIEQYINLTLSPDHAQDDRSKAYKDFAKNFQKARALVLSASNELRSKEQSFKSQLSSALSADEIETAQHLLDASKGDEAFVRASGVLARVGLERHLFAVADSRNIPIQVNPPHKKKPEVEDVITTLYKANVITAIQQSELQSLLRIANNCAHPKEAVKAEDVRRLINRARQLAAVIL